MSQSAVQLFMLSPSGCIKHYTQSIFTILIPANYFLKTESVAMSLKKGFI